jgi:multidrug resistance protein, MATE family
VLRAFFRRQHTKETIVLAWPLVLTQVGHVLTGIADNIFLGRLGPAEQAAGILSNSFYVAVLVFAIGMSYSSTPLVTEANEKGDSAAKISLFSNSLLLNLVVACACFIFLFVCSPALRHMRQPQEVADMAIPFFNVLIFSMLPLSLFFTCKQYCEGLGNTRMALIISIAGNLINIVLNYCLIWGKLGLPAMGYMGSAWATFFARLFMGLSFLFFVYQARLTREVREGLRRIRMDMPVMRKLFRIGFNAALQFTFEVAAFVAAGLICGSFGKEQLDAHGIALNLAAFTYMFGSGIGSAVTIRAGVYYAQQAWEGVKDACNSALILVVMVMGAFAVLFLVFSGVLPKAFSEEPAIIHLSSRLLIVAAMFQLFDGLQVTLIGILRGMHDVRYATAVTLIGYWLLALPLAWVLAYPAGLGAVGVWIALLASLAFVAAGLYFRLRTLLKRNGVLLGRSMPG